MSRRRSRPARTRRRRVSHHAGRRRDRPDRRPSNRSSPSPAARPPPRPPPPPPALRRSPPARGSHPGSPVAELLARRLAVVEGDLPPFLELLPLLVALAGNDDGVARLRPAQRQRDRLAAVDHDLQLLRPSGSACDFADDLLRVLRARVV